MRQFATMAGISNPYLSQIERGLREPSERVLGAIAQSLGMPVDVLYEKAGLTHVDERAQVTRDALAADPLLTGRQRRAVLAVYDAFVALNTRPNARSAAARDAD